MEPRQKLKQQVREAGVINGFFYPYARRWLDKLLELREHNRLFTEPVSTENRYMKLTGVAVTAVSALDSQFSRSTVCSVDAATPRAVDELIAVAVEALAEFEPEDALETGSGGTPVGLMSHNIDDDDGLDDLDFI